MPGKKANRPQSPIAANIVDLAPLLAVVMFLLAISAVLGYLHLLQTWHQQETLQHDVNLARLQARDHLREQREQMAHLAEQQARAGSETRHFLDQAQQLLTQHPEIRLIGWMDGRGQWRTSASQPGTLLPQAQALLQATETVPLSAASSDWTDSRYQIHTQQQGAATEPMVTLQIPIFENQRLRGQLVAFYGLEVMLRQAVSPEMAARYAFALVDDNGRVLAGQTIAPRHDWLHRLTHTTRAQEVVAPLLPADRGLALRMQAWPTHTARVGNITFWLVLGLFGLTIALLIANWSQSRRSRRALQALRTETRFRRTMENSMRTGLRVLDLQGRITYVNPAFCAMTGWTREELIGQTAPYAYWPPEHHASLHERLQEELRGTIDPGGRQVTLRRKNGSLFEARLYTSPLVDEQDQQIGWMASMADITEPNRIRWQLVAARKRFTTVLEALGSSVSVASIGGVELLFANKLYRQWFGESADGHLRMALKGASLRYAARDDDQLDQVDSLVGFPLESMSVGTPDEYTEIYVERLAKWVEVRSRYLHWVDGRLVQIIIATDVTARHEAEERSAAQAEHAEAISRLVTMGEMASSVAHELNQPLTAISNYCTGAISRLDKNRVSPAELREVLNKTAHQAQRAGEVIRHIRGFVKRSAPRRQSTSAREIVNHVVELLETELRRRNVSLTCSLSDPLPGIYADPVLIEQVLMNLIKNSADAIDATGRPERRISLEVSRTGSAQGGDAVCFAVSDTGTGLAASTEKQLYDPFFSTKADGMGIGLSLCRSIIESHQGRIDAQNLYNQEGGLTGCRFAFWLPVKRNNHTTGHTQESATAKTTAP